jgi:hypothetical protein
MYIFDKIKVNLPRHARYAQWGVGPPSIGNPDPGAYHGLPIAHSGLAG